MKLLPTLDEARSELIKAVKKQLKVKEGDCLFWGLIYCQSKTDVEELASVIGCKPFHTERPNAERAASFKDWVEGKERFMVCTSLLGCGVDVKGTTIVYHFGMLWSILDFVLESGRASWGGQPSTSIVFASVDEREPEGDDLYGKHMM